MKKHLLLLLGLMMTSLFGISQASIEGKILDMDTKEGMIEAAVSLKKNGSFIQGTTTDFDGNYAITNLEPGTYDIEVTYLGYQTLQQNGVVLKDGKTNRLNMSIGESDNLLDIGAVIIDYKAPLIEQDNTTQGTTVTAEQIRTLPTKSINAIAATSAGLSTSDSDDDVSIRGSRGDATNYYVDGIRVSQSSIPASEIDQLQVITGGMEAKYGDVTGGIISITSKGPSQKYTGGIEVETSEYLDGYGYNLIAPNISGPILKNKEGQSILGFRLAGQFRSVDDNRPSAVGVYRMPLETIQQLEADPIAFNGVTPIPSVQLLPGDAIGSPLSVRPNENRTDYNVTAKIDARLTDNIDISFSGAYDDFSDQFTPGGDLSGSGGERGWALLNWNRNPYEYGNGFRTSFRFRHRIGKQGLGEDKDNESEGSSSLIRNAFYTIQAGFEKRKNREEDLIHEGNLFNYGFYGNTDVEYRPTATIISDPANWYGSGAVLDGGVILYDHQGETEVSSEFVAGNLNPTLARYTQVNGFTDNALFNVWSGLHQNVGQVYNRFEKGESDRYTFNIASGFDFLPGGSESGRHSIQFGVTYEQRLDRTYIVAPEDLWTLARLQANNRIIGVDTTDVIGTFIQNLPFNGPTEFNQYQTLLSDSEDISFYENIRNELGVGMNQYVNVDALSPDQLSLDYFSAGELNNFGLINYYGYDYTGDKLPSSTTFDDFFTSRDANGTRTFDVAPLQPIYGAAYIGDKFSYKDIIFRLGVRMDYYDANTKVLKTPHALYEIETADAFFARTGQDRPQAVSDDYEVYVSGEDSDNVAGFRFNDQFFLPNGTEVSNGGVLFPGALVNPSYVGKNGERVLNIQDNDFDVNTSFEDYTPQINFMPRLAFSFPISEDANFFAHYDILVQRPPSGTAATARSYYYFENADRTPINNPNLKPEKTIDYEVGFQQKLSASSALKVSAYYKELRDMIQRRTFTFIPEITNYEAFGNLDFGTVKGFSFAYDLRRTNNIQLNATYTLQFADGTGSNPNSSQGLNANGNIRTLLPLSYDERHRLTGVVDYRYKKGEGPKIAGLSVFENAGINLIMTGISGRPYSNLTTVQYISQGEGNGFLGSINGARLPWNFRMDMRIDKSIKFNLGTGDNARALNCNIYFRVSNLLDSKNVIGVFPVTGSAEDDGYLLSSFGQDFISNLEAAESDVENFLSSYQARLLDPGNYTIPRRMFLGAIFDF